MNTALTSSFAFKEKQKMKVVTCNGITFTVADKVFDLSIKYFGKGLKQGSKEWKEKRMDCSGPVTISTTEVPVILGQCEAYGKSKEDFVMQKAGFSPKEDLSLLPAPAYGNELEPYARALYAQRTGSVVMEFPTLTHKEHSWLTGSPDGVTTDGRLVEIKSPITRKVRDSYDIPESYLTQVQMAMEIADLDECAFVQFIPGCFRDDEKDFLTIATIERDREWFKLVFPLLLEVKEEIEEKIKERCDVSPPDCVKVAPQFKDIIAQDRLDQVRCFTPPYRVIEIGKKDNV